MNTEQSTGNPTAGRTQGLLHEDLNWSAQGGDAAFDGQVRALQLRSVVRLMPLTAAINALNVSIVISVFLDSAPLVPLLLWGAAILFAVASSLRGWYRTRGAKQPQSVSPRGIVRATQRGSVLALLWAIPPVWLLPGADPANQLFLVAITTGMMCAGGFALSTIRPAGCAFPLILGVGTAAALVRSDLSVAVPLLCLLVLYSLTVVVSVVITSNTFRARVVAELRAEQQRQVIGLLLRDFEQHAADVLWETDQRLQLRRVSGRLAALLDDAPEALEGIELSELLRRQQAGLSRELLDEAKEARARLVAALAGNRPFRDIALPLRLGERQVWWSFTAKPLGDDGWRGVISDVTVTQDARRHVWNLAHHDTVTGLANRRRFHLILAEAVEHSSTGGSKSALLCIDLDGFKAINDGFGHSVGDQLLAVVARRLERQSRPADLVARLGGDEFGIVLRDVDSAEQVLHAAQRILDTLREPCEVDGISVPIGCCVGCALCPDDGDEPDVLLKHADFALYAAKAAGRNQVRLFSTEMSTGMTRRLSIEHALADALSGQLRLVFQPKQHLGSGRVTGLEALARWTHPELGEISPAEFIPVAEESGHIHEIGRWVLEQACQEAARWGGDVSVAVNISGLQLMRRELGHQVAAALRRSGLEPARLELEITESVLINDTDSVLQTLHDLRALGVRIALDDFGTGYSAMSYLRRFPFDTLKIDRSFLTELANKPDARAIVGAIIELAHALDMETVAEGVEDAEALATLAGHGCDLAQGWHVSYPLPAEEVSPYLVHHAAERDHGAHQVDTIGGRAASGSMASSN